MTIPLIILALIVLYNHLIFCIVAAFSVFNTKSEYLVFCTASGKATPSKTEVFLSAGGLLNWRFYLSKLNDRVFRRKLRFLNFLLLAHLLSLAFFVIRSVP